MSPELSDVVADLCARISALESVRQERFLAWLHKHHRTGQAPTLETLPVFLNAWLGDLTPGGVQWEFQLLLDEITWWHHLPLARLWRMLEEERSQ